MKRIIFFVCMVFATIEACAQTAVNADGTIKHRGNVAIIVTSHFFTFENGVFKKSVDDELTTELKSALNTMAMQKFGNSCFGIVNRDDEAYANVRKVLEEQKLEDYINGFSVQAKGEGADVLFLTDMTTYTEKQVSQIFISCRMINIANNTGFHYSMKTKPIPMSDVYGMKSEIRKMIQQYQDFLYSHILDVYPEQYSIAKVNGKNLYLQAYQPNGRILEDDKFHAFKFGRETFMSEQGNPPVLVLQKLATATGAKEASGYCLVKSDKVLQPSDDIVLFRNQSEPNVTEGPMLFTYFALPYQPNTYEGFIKNRVNNAVYDALTRHPGSMIIEQEHLPDLKKERELQKTEEFLDGHVVEQMKAFGAEYVIHLDNFTMNGSQVSFQLNMVSIQQNKILRTVEVKTSIDNIENEMYKQICERMAYPCSITMTDKKNATILSGWALPVNSKIIIQVNKQIQNPISGEVTYTKVQVCKCSVTEYMGCKSHVKVDEIMSQDDFKLLSQYSDAGFATIMMDGSDIRTNESTVSDIEKTIKKQGKAEKRKAFLNDLREALQDNLRTR